MIRIFHIYNELLQIYIAINAYIKALVIRILLHLRRNGPVLYSCLSRYDQLGLGPVLYSCLSRYDQLGLGPVLYSCLSRYDQLGLKSQPHLAIKN